MFSVEKTSSEIRIGSPVVPARTQTSSNTPNPATYMANAASASESTSASRRLHATMRSLGVISFGLSRSARRDYSNSGAARAKGGPVPRTQFPGTAPTPG